MKYIFSLTLCVGLLLPIAFVPAFGGEVLDGVVATVNHTPLFQSDWDEAICFEAFMRQKPLSQVTEAERVQALQRLIDRQLLNSQMGDAGYMLPSPDELQKDVAKLRAQLPGGNDDQLWQKLLAGYGLTEDVLKQHLANESQVMRFVEVRLRPNVHLQPEEVEAYYNNQVLPDLRQNGQVVSLNEVEPKIRELLTQQRIDALLDAWLHNLRQQSEIHSTIPIPAQRETADSDRASGAN